MLPDAAAIGDAIVADLGNAEPGVFTHAFEPARLWVPRCVTEDLQELTVEVVPRQLADGAVGEKGKGNQARGIAGDDYVVQIYVSQLGRNESDNETADRVVLTAQQILHYLHGAPQDDASYLGRKWKLLDDEHAYTRCMMVSLLGLSYRKFTATS